jgi:hypothetical protein
LDTSESVAGSVTKDEVNMKQGSNTKCTRYRLRGAIFGLTVSALLASSLVGCGEGLETEEEIRSALSAGAGETFDDGDVSDWRPFTGGGATIENRLSSSRATTGTTSMKITYAVPSGGYAGVERRFSPAGAWSGASGLTVAVYGYATGHTFRVQIYDAGNERWDYRFKTSFSGWQQVTMPFTSFTRASYQPSTATANGVLDLGGVVGMALIPSDGTGSGYVYLDTLSLLGATGTVTPLPTTSTSTSSETGATIIPLYSSPSSGHWDAVIAAKQAHPKVPIMAVVNPHSGPGVEARSSYVTGIAKLAAAGIKVIGYVWTQYATRPAAEVQADLRQWRAIYPGVTGMFFDEMEHHGGSEVYYRDLTTYAKSLGFDFTMGNPGADSVPSYIGTVDVIFIYETDGLPSSSRLGGWHANYDKKNFGILPYAVSMSRTFVTSARQHVCYIYMQDDTLPNPWDTLPSYFNDLLAALEQ